MHVTARKQLSAVFYKQVRRLPQRAQIEAAHGSSCRRKTETAHALVKVVLQLCSVVPRWNKSSSTSPTLLLLSQPLHHRSCTLDKTLPKDAATQPATTYLACSTSAALSCSAARAWDW